MNAETMTQRAVDLLTRLVNIPRISREESAAADMLQEYMSGELGLEVNRQGNNLWSVAPRWDDGKETLLLCAHIDTVKPVQGWQHDPFRATREGDRIYGLGTNDDGASLVSLLHTFAVMRDVPCNYNLVFLASAEEEVSGKGGVESVLPLLPRIDVALVGEPTAMQPAIAEKGLMVIDGTAHGRSGHAARDEGDNAIYRAMDDIAWFRNYKFEKESDLLGPVKMTVTILSAGTQHNVVPDSCQFTVDVRANDCYTNRQLFDIISQHVRSEIHARSFRLGSSHIPADHPLVRRAVAQLGGKTFGSPTLSDQALMPFPSLKMGPGQSSRSHSADEFIEIIEISEALAKYMALLRE